MALDLVDAGDNEKNYSKIQKVTHHIPEGVTSRMLYRDIIRIAWPSFIELTLTQLTSMVDMMMVGGLGSWAIAAVGLTNQPKFLLMIMFISMNVGATALVARVVDKAIILTSCTASHFSSRKHSVIHVFKSS